MGLKFKKFRAKLSWKTKEVVPEVVCLRYQVNSEFDNTFTYKPSTSDEVAVRLGTSDEVKQKRVASKPPVLGANFAPARINANNVNHSAKPKELSASRHNGIAKTAPPKGILKKPAQDENLREPTTPTNLTSLTSDNHNISEKSALIFMTENHDYVEETNTKNTTQAPNFQQINLEKNKDPASEDDASSDTQSEAKTVNWRQTIEYYSASEIGPHKQGENRSSSEVTTNDLQDSDFKIHFVNHQNVSARGSESESEESEREDETDVNTHYRDRGGYSSQAASIFFAGEEPEPTRRVRNTAQLDDIEDSAA